MSARSLVRPSKLRSCPDEIVSGVPLCSVTIAETVQSFSSALTTAVSLSK